MSKRQKKDSTYNQNFSDNEEDYTADFESYDFGINGTIESDLKQLNNVSYKDAYEENNLASSKNDELMNSPESICRDFVRNGCRRGRKCKFKHMQSSNYFQTFNIASEPANSKVATAAVQYEVNFCHDYQNNGCNRPQCKFIHCNRSEQDFYYATGILLTTISCSTTNNIPVQYCKDFLSTGCTRLKCKYLHLTKEELEQAVFNQLNPSSNTNTNNLESIVVNKTNPPPPTYLSPPPPLPVSLPPTISPQQFTVSVPMITTNLQQYNPAAILSCSGIPPQPQHSSNMMAAMSAPSVVLPTNAAPTQAATAPGTTNKEDESTSTQHQQQVVYGNIIHHHHAAPSAAAATGSVCALISSENHHLSLPVVGTTSTITNHLPQPPQSVAAAHNLLTNHQVTSKQQPTSVTVLPPPPQSICTQKNTQMPVAETLSFTTNNPPPTIAPISMSLISMAPPCSILSAATTSPDIVTGIRHQQHPQIQNFQIAPSPSPSLSSSVSVTPIVNFDNKSHTQIIDPYSKLMQENEALKKRLLDLETANELLLDQNARLRHVKSSEISITQSPTISSISNNHVYTMGANNNMINKIPCCQGPSTTTNSGASASVSSLIFNNPNTSTNILLSSTNTTTTTTPQQHHTTTHDNSREINNNTTSAEMATITLTLPLPTQTSQNHHKTTNNNINQSTSNNSINKNNSISNLSSSNSEMCVSADNMHNVNKNMNSTNCNNLSKTTQLTNPAHVDNTMATQSCLVTSAIQKIEKTVMPTLQALIGRMEDDQQNHHQYYNNTIKYDTGENNNNEHILINKNNYCEHQNPDMMMPKYKSHEDQYDSNKLKNNQIDIEVPIRSSSCPSVTISSNQHSDGNTTKFLNKNSNNSRVISRVRSIYHQNHANSTSLASTQTCFQ